MVGKIRRFGRLFMEVICFQSVNRLHLLFFTTDNNIIISVDNFDFGLQIGFDDTFTEPRAIRSGDIGHILAKPVRKIFSFVFQYSQVGPKPFRY